MSIICEAGVVLGPGVVIVPGISDQILNLDAGNPSSYPGTGTTWYDISGSGNNATLIGGPSWTNQGSSSSFVWDNNYADAGYILPNTAYTKVAVFKYTTLTSDNIISGNGSGSQHAFWMASSPYLSSGHNGAWTTVQSTSTVDADTWYFGAVSFSTSSGWRLYLNNLTPVTNPDTTPFSDALGQVQIAAFDTGNYFFGNISVVLCYNRVLSDSEVSTLYNTYQSRYNY
jgi:Concanavalin A-like lectin/glucanases superfamily